MKLLCVICLFLLSVGTALSASDRSFVIDYDNNQFLKDGESFRYISGSMHYFRVDTMYWKDRFLKMAAAGLNAVQTYVEWSQHEPEPGVYNFKDNLDLVSYIKLAQKMGLLVILRVGPYIDAERDMGGFPFWLLRENPKMLLRSNDPTYIKYVDKWFGVLLPLLKPLLYANGGPIIAVQVENEYGSHFTCDFTYTSHLRDLFRLHLGNDVVLFTTDGSGDSYLKCGKIQDVYATVDFGPGANVESAFKAQRNHEPRGPLVNSEYYPGWLDHWAYPHVNTSTSSVIQTLDQILSMNASVNFYMFHGGTSFGFTNGAFIYDTFVPSHTSYDSGAPITEAGDLLSVYFAIRECIQKYAPIPPGPVPGPVPKYAYGFVQMKPVGNLFELSTVLRSTTPIPSQNPLTFEQIGQAYGFLMYSTKISGLFMDPALLEISGVRDRAIVAVDKIPVGILSRQDNIVSMPVSIKSGQQLDIFVENQGRVCYGKDINDFKGIVGNVLLSKKVLKGWTMTPFPFNDTDWLEHIMRKLLNDKQQVDRFTAKETTGGAFIPAFYVGSFVVPQKLKAPQDTFLKMQGWNKGVAFINGFNIGRYWPIVGPQVTLYIPASKLKAYPEKNFVWMFELEGSPCQQSNQCQVEFVDTPIIDGPTPHETSFTWESKRMKF